jgi:hypothetical protein
VQDREISDTSARQGNLRHPRLALLPVLDSIYLEIWKLPVLKIEKKSGNYQSIKKVVPYLCVLREGYYVIIWLIVRICVFIKD